MSFLASARQRPTILLIEADADVGFVLEAILRESGLPVIRRDRVRVEDWDRPEVGLVSIGLPLDAAEDPSWLERLRARRPLLPLVVVASTVGNALEAALVADRRACVVYHPVAADAYVAAVSDLLRRGVIARGQVFPGGVRS